MQLSNSAAPNESAFSMFSNFYHVASKVIFHLFYHTKMSYQLYIFKIRKIFLMFIGQNHNEQQMRYNVLERLLSIIYNLQVNRSNGTRIHIRKADWFTKGKYRCEVTAADFETASDDVITEVVGKYGIYTFCSASFNFNLPTICIAIFDSFYFQLYRKEIHTLLVKNLDIQWERLLT